MIGKVWAHLRYEALTAASYRLRFTLSLVGLVLSVVPIYYVTNALQGTMAESIGEQSESYFGFVLIGLIGQQFILASVTAFPSVIQSGIRTGTMEAFFATPTGSPTILAGMVSFQIVWALVKAALLLIVGMLLGATFTGKLVLALPIALLIIASYIPLGLMAAALVIAFRTAGPFPTVVGVGSVLLGGVYYPTTAIPSWIEQLSAVVPLTYGLRALRKTVLAGESLASVYGDLMFLLGLSLLLYVVAAYMVGCSLGYARRTGTLAQY